MKHKHADLIKAWADGAEIQTKLPSYTQDQWLPVEHPNWNSDVWEYRIKPEEKKPVVRWLWAFDGGNNPWGATSSFYTEEELQRLNPPKAIKLEWSRTEFPE